MSDVGKSFSEAGGSGRLLLLLLMEPNRSGAGGSMAPAWNSGHGL